MKTSTFCICENKSADQHRIICEADQRLCYRCTEVIVIRKSHHNNSECTCSMFVRCGIMLKIYQNTVLKSAIRSMLNAYFAASHVSVVPIYAAILSKNQLVNLKQRSALTSIQMPIAL